MASYEYDKKAGTWSVRFRQIDENGAERNRRKRGFETKRAAQQYAAANEFVKVELKRENPCENDEISAESITVEQLCREYLESQKSRVKHSTYEALESRLVNHIIPSFAGVKVKKLTALQVLVWQNALKCSYKYKVLLRSAFTSVLKFGEKYYDLPNVMPKVDPPRNLERKREMEYWTPEEFLKANACTKKHIYRLFLGFLYYSGCRRGEGLAITWDDLNMDTGEVNIDKSITHKTNNGQPWQVVPPKTPGAYRKITLPPKYFKELRLERLERADEPGNYFVFCGERPLPPTSIEREHKAAAERAEVKSIRIHDLRHSHASALISSGASIVTVSRRLGHENIEQTLNTYSHMFPKDEAEAVLKTNKLI